jgi:subtilisin family serine protease
MRSLLTTILLFGWAISAQAATANKGDMLVKVAPEQLSNVEATLKARLPNGTKIENLGIAGWLHIQLPATASVGMNTTTILNQPGVLRSHPNYKITLMDTWTIRDAAKRRDFLKRIQDGGNPFPFPMPGGGGGGANPGADNPAIPTSGSGGSGADPMYAQQWGMNQMGVRESWSITKGRPDMIVAVIDTGVDYTHEDLVDNLWRNPGETGKDAKGADKSSNGVDDDANGFIDDIIGWDFADKDNKPYDLAGQLMDVVLKGENPGHGTHCAGNVGARADNGKGIGGVAPGVKIMALRFITEKGQGTTADAISAIKYATDNGAKVLSNSWGSEGDDGDTDAQALKDAISYAKDHNVLFVAAAGNGHQGKGYDNDSDAKPGVPASYNIDNIVSVAAIDEKGAMGSFSNWGAKTVHLAAPGVKVFSTTVGQTYNDTIINMGPIVATWDGTSMATPHVAGAAALYWSKHPEMNYAQVKQALIQYVKPNPALSGKMVSGGQLDVHTMMQH